MELDLTFVKSNDIILSSLLKWAAFFCDIYVINKKTSKTDPQYQVELVQINDTLGILIKWLNLSHSLDAYSTAFFSMSKFLRSWKNALQSLNQVFIFNGINSSPNLVIKFDSLLFINMNFFNNFFNSYEYNSSSEEDNEESDDDVVMAESNRDRDRDRGRQKRKKNKGTQSHSGPPSLAGGGGGGSIPEEPPKHHIRSPILEETESSIEAELKSQERLANDRSETNLNQVLQWQQVGGELSIDDFC